MLNARFPVLLFSNGIGDHFLNLPAVRALVHLFPNRLALICEGGETRSILSGIRFRKICEVPEVRGEVLFDANRVAAKVGPCDLFISLIPWHSSSVDRLLQRLAPSFSIGFFREFQRRVKLNFDKHSAELAFDVPRVFDPSLSLDAFSGPPIFPSTFVAQAHRVRRLFPRGFRVLAVHADTEIQKMWPRQRFIKLLDMFLQRRPDFLVVIVGVANLSLDRGCHGNRVIPAYGLPLATSALLVGWSDLFVGIDSSMLHAADLFRVPGAGIFGSTNPKEWGFRFAPHRHVCALESMSTLHETTVLEALEDLLAERERCPVECGELGGDRYANGHTP